MQKIVNLIGAGPGDPDLLTIKALRTIEQADVVVYDRLVSDEILNLIPEKVERVYAGKQCGKHSMTQEEINNTLIELTNKYNSVVRLKGGDSFVFGRGSEEALALKGAGINFNVVPGITSGLAAATYAGIPITHRALSRGVLFITGHFQNDEELKFDWRGIANEELTLVIYMGLANINLITTKLIEHGLDAATATAVVQNGTTNRQRKIVATLATIEEEVKQAKVEPPALIIIGKVVELNSQLEWFGINELRKEFS